MNSVTWNGKNTSELEAILRNHEVACEPDGTKLHLYGIGINLHIREGDTVTVDGDSLGIQRLHPEPKADKYLTWTGVNVADFQDFLKLYGVDIVVVGEQLNIYGGAELIASLGRGDRVTKRNGQVIVTRAGQHHRH